MGLKFRALLAMRQVAEAIGLPGVDQRDVAENGIFQQAQAAVDRSGFTTVGEDRIGGGRCVKRLHAGAGRPDAFGEGALRHDLQLQIAAGVLTAGDAVGADETADQFAHMAGGQQFGDWSVVAAAGVDHEGEVARALFREAAHQRRRRAGTEPRHKHRRTVLNAAMAVRRSETNLSIMRRMLPQVGRWRKEPAGLART